MILPEVLEQDYQTIESIRDLTPTHFLGQSMEKWQFQHIAKVCDAWWLHSGNPVHPHAELTPDRCSNGFISCREIFKYPNLCHVMAHEMLKVVFRGNSRPPDWIVGSSFGATPLVGALSFVTNAKHACTEKTQDKCQIWREFEILPDEDVLHIEELMVTASTAEAVRAGIKAGNPHPVRFRAALPVLVYRSRIQKVEHSHISPVFSFPEMQDWEQAECPLCQMGSERIRPKESREGWLRLAYPDG